MFFSLISVYGNRISSIGTVGLFVFVFSLETHNHGIAILYNALWFSAGGLWYMLLALLSFRLKPYKIAQQLLGENLAEISVYLNLKASFYLPNANEKALYDDLMKSQSAIQQHQDNLRKILFKTRQFVKESNVKSRSLLLMFLNSIDLFERIMTAQQDYQQLHKDFDGTPILAQYYSCIHTLAQQLHTIGLAVQNEKPLSDTGNIDNAINNAKNAFAEFRKNTLDTSNIEGFIKLRNILESLEDIAKRIKQLQLFTLYDKKLNRKFKRDVDLSLFVTHNEIDPQLLMENLTLRSNSFRHALRVTTALLIGYFVSLFFPVGHGYWILLTITSIVKLAYGLTKQRNINRLLGTLIGAATGFIMLHFMQDRAALFVVMLLAMVIAYSFIRLNYLISSIAITIYVLLAFYFLNPHSIQVVLSDRVVDTIIGSLIAFLISISVFPNWEHEKTGEYILAALEANRSYFKTAATIFFNTAYDVTEFKLARKGAFVALANLSDSFQRMLSEPKRKQPNMEEIHQFVATNQLLTSYIASLSYYAQTMEETSLPAFEPLVTKVDNTFQQAINAYNHNAATTFPEAIGKDSLQLKIDELLTQRQKEIMVDKDEPTSTGKGLRFLQTINNQFDLIDTVVNDQVKILQKIVA